MEKIFLLVCFVAFAQYAASQRTFGLKTGLNLSDQNRTVISPQNPSGHTTETKSILSYQLGAFYKTSIDSYWKFSSEINFSVIGSKTQYVTEQQLLYPDGANHYSKNKIGYISVPLSLQYRFNKLYIGAGPTISFKVFSKITNFENRTFKTKFYQTLDAGAFFLAGYNFTKKYDVNLGYSYGLVNIEGANNYFKTKNRFLNLSLLYNLK